MGTGDEAADNSQFKLKHSNLRLKIGGTPHAGDPSTVEKKIAAILSPVDEKPLLFDESEPVSPAVSEVFAGVKANITEFREYSEVGFKPCLLDISLQKKANSTEMSMQIAESEVTSGFCFPSGQIFTLEMHRET